MTIVDQVRTAVADAHAEGRQPPGRTVLAKLTGAKDHQVRAALGVVAEERRAADSPVYDDVPPWSDGPTTGAVTVAGGEPVEPAGHQQPPDSRAQRSGNVAAPRPGTGRRIHHPLHRGMAGLMVGTPADRALLAQAARLNQSLGEIVLRLFGNLDANGGLQANDLREVRDALQALTTVFERRLAELANTVDAEPPGLDAR